MKESKKICIGTVSPANDLDKLRKKDTTCSEVVFSNDQMQHVSEVMLNQAVFHKDGSIPPRCVTRNTLFISFYSSTSIP